MTDYLEKVRKYDAGADEAVVAKLVKHLGIALRNRDSSLVSCSDPAELGRVRKGFMTKKLALDLDDAGKDAILAKVCQTMKGDRAKSRVAFYYLVAKETGKLSLFA